MPSEPRQTLFACKTTKLKLPGYHLCVRLPNTLDIDGSRLTLPLRGLVRGVPEAISFSGQIKNIGVGSLGLGDGAPRGYAVRRVARVQWH
jgi:hypothetical protein